MTVTIGVGQYPENILEDLAETHTVYSIDGNQAAAELGNSKVLNSVVLGLAAKYLPFEEQDWLDTIATTVPPKTVALNQEAFKKGYTA
jgi:indolepyruvate ferredoxin oxidoreductase beta subunit